MNKQLKILKSYVSTLADSIDKNKHIDSNYKLLLKQNILLINGLIDKYVESVNEKVIKSIKIDVYNYKCSDIHTKEPKFTYDDVVIYLDEGIVKTGKIVARFHSSVCNEFIYKIKNGKRIYECDIIGKVERQ